MARKQYTRVNAAIRASEVRLINERGEMLGVRPIATALTMAQNAGYDLIEIAPNAIPPVCRIGNFSKFLYEKGKKLKDSRKGRGGSKLKEIRIRPKIGAHDLDVKLSAILKFLKDRHKVRVSFVFYGREMEHRDIAVKYLEKIEECITGVGALEQRPQMYGNRMVSILVPQKG